MLSKLYTLRDAKAESYAPPFAQPSKGSAIRFFIDLCTDKGNNFGRHPEDYALYELGLYDDATAGFELYDTPLHVGNALDLIPKS